MTREEEGRVFEEEKSKGGADSISSSNLSSLLASKDRDFLLSPTGTPAAAYVVFAANTAAVQASAVAITGEKSFQWMKLCNRFTRFCFQIGGGLISGYIAAVLMAITASISAYSLFRLYSPKQFLRLKGR